MKRKTSLDLIRSLAIFFVLSVHFFLNSNFYTKPIGGIDYLPLLFFRTLFFTCVPLFLLLTGYLQNKKEISGKYYKGIKKIIISFLFISVLSLVFNKVCLHNNDRILKGIINIFDYKTNEYSWYIEMYIGLFFLIPFLNILYNNIDSQKNKKILIATLAGLVSFGSLINSIKFQKMYVHIVPDYWNIIYPLLYYFIGCYISEYQIKINKKKGIICMLGMLLISTGFLYVYNKGEIFSWSFLGEYGGITTVITSTILFLLLYDINITNKYTTKVLTTISLLSLDMYLFSYITDHYFYHDVSCTKALDYLILFLKIMPLSFISAFILSYIKKLLFVLLSKIKFIDKILN